MPDAQTNGRPDDLSAVLSLMARLDELRAAGVEPDLDDFCPDPRLREELRRRVAASAVFANAPADGTTPGLPSTAPTACPPLLPNTVIEPPGYKIERELGRGQFGVVYRARAEKLDRVVALKSLTRATAETVGRLLIEARAMAAIRHPHVALIHDVVEHAGVQFLVLEYLPGGTLCERLRGGPLPYRDAAELVARVARGVEAAHDLGIVHRDLKPGNILFDRAGAGGMPKVSDFGMAKYGNSDLTVPEAVIGTPAYMSPEQAGARGKFAQPPADVWALGVILYECVTGARPFAGRTIMEVLMQITNDDPKPMREFVSGVPADLQTIVDKCLRRDERDRYATAKDLAEDLEAFLRNAPIKARPRRWRERAVQWVLRKPGAAAAWVLAPLVAAAAAVALAFGWLWQDAEQARENLGRAKAEQMRQQQDAAQQKLEARDREIKETRARFEYARAVGAAHREWHAGEPATARLRLAGLAPQWPDWEWSYVRRLCQPALAVGGAENAGPVHAAAFDASGARAATGHGDGSVRVWDVATRTAGPPFRVPNSGGVLAVAFSPDWKTLAVGTANNRVVVYDLASGIELFNRGRDAVVKAVAFSPDGKTLVAGGLSAHFWNTETWTERAVRIKHADTVSSIAYSPDGTRVLTASWDGTARLSSATTGEQVYPLDSVSPQYVLSAAFSANGERVVTACSEGVVRVWDVKDTKDAEPRVLKSFSRPPGAVWAVALSPDGDRVITAEGGPDGAGNAARVWDVSGDGAVELFAVRAHAGAVLAAAYSRDGARILTASDDGTAGVWSGFTGGESLALRGRPLRPDGTPAVPVALGYTADGTRLVAAYDGAPALAWDAASGKPVERHAEPVPPKARTPVGNGQHTAALDAAGGVTVSDDKTGIAFKLVGHTGPVNGVALNPGGTRIATAGQDGTARVWDVLYGIELLCIKPSGGPVRVVTWGPDGTRLVTATEGGVIQVWDSKP